MNETWILITILISLIIGVFIDYFFFRIWHRYAHSKELRKLEKERKEKEYTGIW